MSRRKQSNPRSLFKEEPVADSPEILSAPTHPDLIQSTPEDAMTLDQLIAEDGQPEEKFICDTCSVSFSSLSQFTTHKELGCTQGKAGVSLNDGFASDLHESTIPQDLSKPAQPRTPTKRLDRLDHPESPFRPEENGSPLRKPHEGSPSVAVIQVDGKGISEEDLYGGRGWELSFDRLPTVMPNPEGFFECGLCKEKFAKLTHLLEHEQNHPDYLPFKCKYCQRQFRHKRSLIRHVRLHLGDRRYKCEFCGMAFVRSDHLKNHKKTHTQCNKPREEEKTDLPRVINPKDTPQEMKVNQAMRLSLMEMLERDRMNRTPNSNGDMNDTPLMEIPPKLDDAAITSLNLFSVAQPYRQKGVVPSIGFTADTPSSQPLSLKRTFEPQLDPAHSKRLKIDISPPDEYAHLDSHLRDWVHTRRQDGIDVNQTIFESYAQRKFSEFYLRSPAPLDWLLDLAKQLDVKPVEMNGTGLKRSPSNSSLTLNIKRELQSQSQAVYSCPECSQEFSAEDDLETHLSDHLLKISTEYGCNSCLKLYATPDDLQKHLIDLHAHHIFRCSLCNRSFESKPEIQIHFSIEHSEQCRVFTCKTCAMVFHSERQWQLHLKVHHLGTLKPFRCLLCTNSFSTESELEQHVSSHKKAYQCHFCSEAFHVEYLLDKHVQTSHQAGKEIEAPSSNHVEPPIAKPDFNSPAAAPAANKEKSRLYYNCDRCTASFPNYQMYKGHYVHKHGLKPKLSPLGRKEHTADVKNLGSSSWEMCFLCLRSYRTRVELERHLITHFAIGRLKCNICDSEFPSIKLLAEHRLTHCKLASSNTCIVCKTPLNTKADFLQHVSDHGRHEVSSMHCVLCQQSLASTIDLEVHSDYHFSESLNNYSCKMCNKDFSNPQHVEFHMEGGAAFYLCKTCSRKNVKCRQCGVNASESAEFVYDSDRLSGECKQCSGSSSSLPSIVHCVACRRNFVSKSDVCEKLNSKGIPYYLCRVCMGDAEKVTDTVLTRTCFMCLYTFTSDEHLIASFDAKDRLCTLCRGCYPGSFVCSKCGKSRTSMKLMVVETDERGSKSSVCLNCEAANETAEAKPTDTISCPQCDNTFDTQAALDEHAQTHKAFQCLKCDRVFQSEAEIEQHVSIHLMDGSENVCRLCEVECNSPAKLQIHLIEHNFPQGNFCCPLCESTFTDSAALQTHVHEHGTFSGENACSKCDKKFHFVAELQHHIMSAHSESLDLERKLDDLDDSLEDSQNKTDISCPLCKETFEGASTFQVHFFASHSNLDLTSLPLKDGLGGTQKKRAGSSSLQLTPTSDGGDEYLTRRFPCNLCGKRFKRKAHMRRHMTTHDRAVQRVEPDPNKEKFRCKVCGVEYNQVKNLRRHMQVYHETGLTQVPRNSPDINFATQPLTEIVNNPKDLKEATEKVVAPGQVGSLHLTATESKGNEINTTSPSSHSSASVEPATSVRFQDTPPKEPDHSDATPSSPNDSAASDDIPSDDLQHPLLLHKSPIQPVVVDFPANVSLTS